MSNISICATDDYYKDICGSEEKGRCAPIEDSFKNVWDDSDTTARAKAEDVWNKIPAKPFYLEGSSLYDICSDRQIQESAVDEDTEVSHCDIATKHILAKSQIQEGGIVDRYWDEHTGQTNCMFLDQDYGYGDGKGRTARQICEKVEEKKEELLMSEFDLGFIKIMDLTPEATLEAIKSFGADAVNEVINKSTLTLNPKTIVSQRNDCNNKSYINMGNQIIAGCDMDIVALKEAMDVELSPELLKELTRSSVSGVKQLSLLEMVQSCQMSTTMNGLLNMQASVDNQALQQAMAESTGDTASANASNLTCNDISIDMSPCMYINQTNCCGNTIDFEGVNTITAGCNSTVIDIVQEQNAKKLQVCNTITDTSMTTDLASKVFNTTAQTADAESTATDYTVVIIVVLVMFAAAMYFYISYMKKYALVGIVLGVILIIAGALFVTYYFRTRVLKGVTYQLPYSVWSDCETDLTQKTQWGIAKELFDSSPVYKALDFFPDVNESDNRTIIKGDNEDGTYSDGSMTYVDYRNLPSKWSGTAVFMKNPVASGESEGLCIVEPDSEGVCPPENVTYVITKNKTFEEITSLYAGICLILAGILLTVLSGVMMSEAMNDNLLNQQMSGSFMDPYNQQTNGSFL